MQPSEALGVAAQVAVTLAGFAGIVVVFRPQSVHAWSAIDRYRLVLLLMNSAVPLVLSLFGLLLLTMAPPPVAIWRWCSGVCFTAQITAFALSSRPLTRLGPADLKAINKFVFYGMGALTFAATVLQALNFAMWNKFWPFHAGIFVHLFAAIVQFLRLILLPPRSANQL
jgi:hypothetical protein